MYKFLVCTMTSFIVQGWNRVTLHSWLETDQYMVITSGCTTDQDNSGFHTSLTWAIFSEGFGLTTGTMLWSVKALTIIVTATLIRILQGSSLKAYTAHQAAHAQSSWKHCPSRTRHPAHSKQITWYATFHCALANRQVTRIVGRI